MDVIKGMEGGGGVMAIVRPPNLLLLIFLIAHCGCRSTDHTI